MASLQQEYDDAMVTADIVMRELERRIDRVRSGLVRVVEEVEQGRIKNGLTAAHGALEAIAALQGACDSRDLAQWRRQHELKLKRRGQQQQVLTLKLLAAKDLLLEAGWDGEALEEHLKANAPMGRRAVQQSYRERAARRRLAGQVARQISAGREGA